MSRNSEVNNERKAQILAEAALEDIDYTAVWEVFDDITEDDAGTILRLARNATITIAP